MAFTYKEIKERIEEIKNEERPEDAGAKILALESELMADTEENEDLKARIKELESDVFARDERIANLKKRNAELLFAIGERIETPKTEEVKEDVTEYEVRDYRNLVKDMG